MVVGVQGMLKVNYKISHFAKPIKRPCTITRPACLGVEIGVLTKGAMFFQPQKILNYCLIFWVGWEFKSQQVNWGDYAMPTTWHSKPDQLVMLAHAVVSSVMIL